MSVIPNTSHLAESNPTPPQPLPDILRALDTMTSAFRRHRGASTHGHLELISETRGLVELSAELNSLSDLLGHALLRELSEKRPERALYDLICLERDLDMSPDHTAMTTSVTPTPVESFNRIQTEERYLTPRDTTLEETPEETPEEPLEEIQERVVSPTLQPVAEIPESLQIGKPRWGWNNQLIHRAARGELFRVVTPSSQRARHDFDNAERALNYLEDQLNSGPSSAQIERALKSALNSPLQASDSRLCSLMLNHEIPEGKSFKKLRREVRNFKDDIEFDLAEASRDHGDDLWEHAQLFAGQRIELVGGDIVQHVLNKIRHDIPDAEINWTPTSSKSGERMLISLEESARRGTVSVIILIKSFIGHRVSTRFMPLNQLVFSDGHQFAVKYISRGYGVSKIKSVLLTCAQERGQL